MRLNDALFADNGGCGYVLKPPSLRADAPGGDLPDAPRARASRLVVRVLSGQQLPRPNGEQRGEVIDPYVRVTLHCAGFEPQSSRTLREDDNGFNPVWNEEFVFAVPCDRHDGVGFVEIEVLDYDLGKDDDWIAQAVVPLAALRPGVRRVPLADERSARHGDYADASLLCFFAWHEDTAS